MAERVHGFIAASTVHVTTLLVVTFVTYIGTVSVHCLVWALHVMYVLTFKMRELLIFVLCGTDVY